MTRFSCDSCDRSFASKRNLQYHIKKKVCEKQGKYICNFCDKELSSSSSLYRHKTKACKKRFSEKNDKVNKNNIDTIERDELFKLIKDMQAQINKLKKDAVTEKITNNVKNGNIYNGDVNIMVNVVPFGKEDLSKISKNDLLKVFRSGFNSALQLTETTHFNPKYPEYHNVYISSMKNKYAMTYDGTDWALVMKDDLINDMYDKKRDYIEENMDEFINSLTPSQINALHRWLEVDDDHKYIQKIKNDMKLLLYNKRKMALEPKPIITISDSDEIYEEVSEIRNAKRLHIKKKSNGSKNIKKVVRRNND